MRLRFAVLGWIVAWGIGFGAADKAIAAEEVILKYSAIERTIPVSDLSNFAETGQLTRPLRRYLRLSRQRPDRVRRILSYQAPLDVRAIDRILNSPVGSLALAQTARAIYTPSRGADQAALRSALVAAAADGRVSLIEVIRNYPTQQVYVDSERLLEVVRQIAALQDQFGGLFQGMPLPR